MKDIIGVTHPIPTKYAERIYAEGKTVFIGKSYLNKVSKGDKFIIYESQGAKKYTGWADIKSIGKEKTSNIMRKFGNNLMITKEELQVYAKGRLEMNYCEFENFEKFENPVKPSRFIPIRGKYIYKDEFRTIEMKRSNDSE